ncbi:MAG: AtpZ/AtpI family protein [Desulfovibrio sp.]|nr:AtpZ/AtpI family protein [Desulfovibrio sp.]
MEEQKPHIRKGLSDFFYQQRDGINALSSVGVIGLHMVTGPLLGFAIGYGIDTYFEVHPWGKILFLLIGIAAGFLNVYRDTQILLKKLSKKD